MTKKSLLVLLFLLVLPILVLGYDRNIEKNDNLSQKLCASSSSEELFYSTYIGGSSEDGVLDIFVDDEGFIYLCGYTKSTDFFATTDAYDQSFNGVGDGYIMKLTPNGETIVFSTLIGGSGIDVCYNLEVDKNGYIYVGGQTYSTNFPTTSGSFDESFNGGTSNPDYYICKLNPDGSSLNYSTFIGGTEGDYFAALAIDVKGRVYAVGNTWSSNYPTTLEAYDRTFNGVADWFLTVLNENGTQLSCSTFIGSSGTETAKCIVLDGKDGVYIGGNTNSANFPTTENAYQNTTAGDYEYAFLKYNLTGNDLEFSTYLGGSGWDALNCQIALDDEENIIFSGVTRSADFPNTELGDWSNFSGGDDVFIAKFDPSGSILLKSAIYGGTSDDNVYDMIIEDKGDISIAGNTKSEDFPTDPGAYNKNLNGSQDFFFLRLTDDWTELNFSTYLGGNDVDNTEAMAIMNNNYYFIGKTQSSEFITTENAVSRQLNGTQDGFLMIFNLPIIPEDEFNIPGFNLRIIILLISFSCLILMVHIQIKKRRII